MTLRPITRADASLTLGWRNQVSVRSGMFNPGIVDSDQHEGWISRTVADPARHYFVYEVNSRPLGVTGFTFRDLSTREAEWSFYIGATDAPKHAGTSMLQDALRAFFTDLDGTVLNGEVIDCNRASMRLHEKLGFRSLGPRDDTILHNGEEKQVHLFRMSRELWRASYSEPVSGLPDTAMDRQV